MIVPFFVFVCITTVLFAKSSSDNKNTKFTMGVLGGLNIPQLSGGKSNELSRDYTSRLGEVFGLTTSYSLSSNFALRVDALYSSEGGKRNGVQAIDAASFNPQAPAGTYLYANFKNKTILNYFELPAMAKYTFPSRSSLKFYINLGPYMGIILNAKQKTSGSSMVYMDRAETTPVSPAAVPFDASTSTTSSIHPVNVGITGGIGIAHTLGMGNLFLDVRGAYGFTVVQKYKQDGSSHTGSLFVALGYSFAL
jgi:hypothetical protein